MKTKEELIEKQADEIRQFEKEQAIRALLPDKYQDAALVCIHGKFASVRMWNNFRTDKKLSDAKEIISFFKDKLVECEHWQSGCVSTWPAAINSCINDESAVMDGSHAIEIKVSGGRGFGPDVEIRFWIETDCGLIEIGCPVCDLWKLVPRVKATYNKHGEVCECTIDWPVESRCVDSFRKFWAEKPGYSGSYYLADLPNFESWASNQAS